MNVISHTQTEHLGDIIDKIAALKSILECPTAPGICVEQLRTKLPPIIDELKRFHRSVALGDRWQTSA
jgi:hypothetical protein